MPCEKHDSTSCGSCAAVYETTCPAAGLDEELWEVISLWRAHDAHGLYPDPGAALDQSVWLVSAFSAVSSAHGAVRREAEENARRAASRKRRP